MSSTNRESIETSIFDWSEWDEDGPMALTFYNVTLKVPVGEFSAGAQFERAFINGENSYLQLVEDNGEYHEYELKFSVGDRLPSLI